MSESATPSPAHPKSVQTTLAQTRKPRPADEWTSQHLFRPLAQRLVDPAARLGIRPTTVVLLHTGLGLLAAWQLHRGQLDRGRLDRGRGFLASRLAPALLIQLKTVLDNLDGQLARATGQTSEVGRYLDSEMDVVVNAALLCGVLGLRGGAAATLLLSFIMTAEFVWERDYREARGEVFRAPPAQTGDHPQLLAALRGAYAAYFGPQEQLLGGLLEWRLRRLAGTDPTPQQRQTWTPLPLNTVTANLGLSSQLLGLGVCVLLGRPRLYARTLPVQAGALLALHLWRERRMRRGR